MMKWIFLLLAGTACSVHHAAMDPAKLDPAFAALIAGQKNGAVAPATPHQPQPTADATGEKRYDCIVYTKQAAALRKKGIVIRSVLPEFVTAWATLKQIKQMAAMTEVTYIEAPKMNFPDRQEHPLR